MKKILFLIFCLISVNAIAATKDVTPRADNEGNIGTASLTWAAGHFLAMTVAGQSVCLEDGTDCPAAGSGDITDVGNVSSGAAFTGTQGTSLIFNDAGGDVTVALNSLDKFSFNTASTDNLNIGIGTTNPLSSIDIRVDSEDGTSAVDLYTSNEGSSLRGYLLGGSLASPAVAPDAENVLFIEGYAHDGTDYHRAAMIRLGMDINSVVGDNDTPGMIDFWTSPDGSNNDQLVGSINEDGNWLIGSNYTYLGHFAIDGNEDEIQLVVQGNATQTTNLIVAENSAGTDQFTVSNTGDVFSSSTITATVGFDIVGAADIDYGSADVTDHTFITDGTGDAEIVLPDDSIGDAEIAFDEVTGADLTLTDAVAVTTSGKIISNANLDVKNGATSSGVLAIFEDSDDGTNKATFQVPALAADTVYILPADDGDADQVLSTNGTGTLDWVAAGAGDVTGVGDCTSGDCLDGTSDGGTYIRLYDGDSNYTEINNVDANQSANLKWILPSANGTAGQILEIASVASDTITLEWDTDGGSGGGGATEVILPIYSAKLTGTFPLDGDATQGAQIDAGDGNWRLLFDATTDEGAVWQFRMPNNYSSTPVLKIQYTMASATTNEVEFEGAIMCVTDADAADVGTASFSAIAVGSATVPGTAGYMDEISISLTDDSCAAADAVWVYLSTDSDDATNDDATGDREVINVSLSYTGA